MHTHARVPLLRACRAALARLCCYVAHAAACVSMRGAALQIAIVIMHLGRLAVNSDAIVILMALQCILLWLRLQYYLRCAAAQPRVRSSRTRCSSSRAPRKHGQCAADFAWRPDSVVGMWDAAADGHH